MRNGSVGIRRQSNDGCIDISDCGRKAACDQSRARQTLSEDSFETDASAALKWYQGIRRSIPQEDLVTAIDEFDSRRRPTRAGSKDGYPHYLTIRSRDARVIPAIDHTM
jgi:hypothetical protein